MVSELLQGGLTINVSISKGNSKMGDVQSVSLPAITTCRQGCPCAKKCYALRISRRRPSVKDAYERNYRILQEDPNTYWREVEAAIMLSRFFRFHVSGDIPDVDYLTRMVEVAKRNQHCEMLCFTKKYELVNDWIQSYGDLPNNLHLVFSVWQDLHFDNPYLLPEAHVRYRNGHTTASEIAIECNGNCTECAVTDGGCWTLARGQQVIFNEH